VHHEQAIFKIMSAEREQSFPAYNAMECLLDKLKLLNYEAEFFKETKMKPIHRQVVSLLIFAP
jgi:hypothetical protein